MNDSISRQAAIDAITDELMPSTPLSVVIRAKNRLKGLPAAQPDHNADISKKAEGDCISRQAAIDAIMGQPPEPHYPSWYAAQIEKLPAAQPATNCSEIPNKSDTISRQAALDIYDDYNVAVENGELKAYGKHRKRLLELPPAQPDRKLIDNYMWKIKQNISAHTAAEGVIAIKYYLEQIYEQIYGGGEKPWWMI